jgi:small-conductance mechanosensitive channel
MDFAELWTDDELRRNAIATLALLVVVIVSRVVAVRAVRSFAKPLRETLRLRWAAYVRRVAWAALALGTIAIWATELQAFALSVVAFAMAIVLATKELILCVSGSVLRTSAGSFTIGDRIEVGDYRGDVIDHGFLTTTILEIGPTHQRTGRVVSIPNSLFLSESVVNETATDNYVLHTFRIPLAKTQRWKEAEKTLLDVANEVCADYVAPAYRQLDAVSSQHGLKGATVEPRVSLLMGDDGAVSLLLRVPVPARDKGTVEQGIVRGFLSRTGVGLSG